MQARKSMPADNALLSIVIPMFNAGAFIEATLDSIARQKGLNMEIIVVDDVSNDNSVAIARKWGKSHSDIPLRVIEQPEKSYTLKGRLAGVKAARGADIMFVDADDRVPGENRLARILAAKRKGNYDIAHFRSQFHEQSVGEVIWNMPIGSKPLFGAEIFAAYAKMNFPPVLIWGKIYSSTLLRLALPLAEQIRIFRLEDVFLFSLLMFLARSYCPVDEYAYLYELSNNWPAEKFAGRVHDLYFIESFFKTLFEKYATPRQDRENFMAFLKDRLEFNMNNLCMAMLERLDGESCAKKLMASLQPYLEDVPILSLLWPIVSKTQGKIARLDNRINDDSTQSD